MNQILLFTGIHALTSQLEQIKMLGPPGDMVGFRNARFREALGLQDVAEFVTDGIEGKPFERA